MICVRLVGRCGRAGCGRGARASVEASRPVAAGGLGPPASGPVDADAADAGPTVHTQAVDTVAITWYCVVGQIVQRPEGARCVRLHRFAIEKKKKTNRSKRLTLIIKARGAEEESFFRLKRTRKVFAQNS